MLCHEDLQNYLQNNFALMYFHHMPVDYLDRLPVWQYTTYLDLLNIELDKQRLEQQTLNR